MPKEKKIIRTRKSISRNPIKIDASPRQLRTSIEKITYNSSRGKVESPEKKLPGIMKKQKRAGNDDL